MPGPKTFDADIHTLPTKKGKDLANPLLTQRVDLDDPLLKGKLRSVTKEHVSFVVFLMGIVLIFAALVGSVALMLVMGAVLLLAGAIDLYRHHRRVIAKAGKEAFTARLYVPEGPLAATDLEGFDPARDGHLAETLFNGMYRLGDLHRSAKRLMEMFEPTAHFTLSAKNLACEYNRALENMVAHPLYQIHLKKSQELREDTDFWNDVVSLSRFHRPERG